MFTSKLIDKKILSAVLVSMICIFGFSINSMAATDATIAGIETVTPAADLVKSINEADEVTAPFVITPPSVDNAGLITVDLVIFAGQSNMSGVGGNAVDAPTVANGEGYEFRQGKCETGLYSVVEPFGIYANGYLSDPDGLRNGTLVSAFMNTYYGRTGVPVMGVSAARGGTDINFWNQQEVQQDLLNKYMSAKAWCASNNVRIRHQYVVWLQGESDAIAGMSGAEYQNKLKSAFAVLNKKGIEQIFIITIGNAGGFPGAYDVIVNAQEDLCARDPHFTLGTDVLHTLPDVCTPDTIHYDQKSLNQAGSLCATTCATYSAMKR